MSAFQTRAPASLDPFAAAKPAAAPLASGGQTQTLGASAPAVQNQGQAGGAAASAHPWLAHMGKDLGLGLGVAVTEGLGLLPSWNQPVLDAGGKPVASVPGVQRIGDHDILKRHQEVVGPQLTAVDAKIAPGALHDFVGGLASGATQAPGASYRLEAHIADALHGDQTRK